MNLNNPNLDFGLEQELLANALKGYEGQRNIQPSGRIVGGYGGLANQIGQALMGGVGQSVTERKMRDLSQEERQRVRSLSDQISTPGTRQQSVLTQTLGEGQMGPEQETSEAVPLGPVEENQRQLKLAMEMMNLPSGRAAATQFVNSGVGFPERWAEREAEEEKQRRIQDDRYSYELMRDENRDAMTREGFARADARARMTGGGGGGTGARGTSLVGAAVRGPDGVMYRYTSDGRAVPVMGPDGEPFRAAGPAGASGGAGGYNPEKVAHVVRQGRSVIANMRQQLGGLRDDPFGTVVEGGPMLPNLMRSIAGTGPGQVAGKAVGLPAQGRRDRFGTSRQQLLGIFKIVAELPAAMMNSNLEMMNWLNSLGDVGSMSDKTIDNAVNVIEMWFNEIEKPDGTMDAVRPAMDGVGQMYEQDTRQNLPQTEDEALSLAQPGTPRANYRDIDESGPPEGISAEDWEFFTPEQRRLWR